MIAPPAVMMTLDEWAQRWGLPREALNELFQGVIHAGTGNIESSESRVQSEVRLEASRANVLLFRNNIGAGKLESGNWVRFGLANDSERMNDRIKSGDLIGIRRVVITPSMMGSAIGQFVSREVKRGDWKFSGTPQEQAQARWASLINAHGGDARIVQGPGSFD